MQLLRRSSTIRSKARPAVRTRSTGTISYSSDRIGLIFSVPPSQAWALPMRPPRRRYSSVSRQNQMLSDLARLAHAREDARPCRRPRARRRRRRARACPCPPQAVSESSTSTRSPRPRSASSAVRLAGGLAGARDAAGEVDRDDVLAGLDQRLPHGEEVADRGLGGGGQLGVAAQPLVEGVEAVHLELALRFAPASPRTG